LDKEVNQKTEEAKVKAAVEKKRKGARERQKKHRELVKKAKQAAKRMSINDVLSHLITIDTQNLLFSCRFHMTATQRGIQMILKIMQRYHDQNQTGKERGMGSKVGQDRKSTREPTGITPSCFPSSIARPVSLAGLPNPL
jgi:acyl-CoA reductase-like NAD-dependent aldehyde dehydrogenase